MSDEPSLDVPPSIEIQMQIDRGGLDIVMAQMVLDVRYGMATIEHINCSRVTEASNGIDIFEAFGSKGLFEIFPADAVDTIAGELLSPLIEKKPVLIEQFWCYAVFPDIGLEEMTGLGLELYEPEPVSFSQDSQGFFLTVKVIQIQCCYFAGPGRGIIEQMKQGIISEPLFSFEINGLKDLQDLILIKKAD